MNFRSARRSRRIHPGARAIAMAGVIAAVVAGSSPTLVLSAPHGLLFSFGRQLAQEQNAGLPLAQFSAQFPKGSLRDAFEVQKHLVKALAPRHRVAGFKGGANTKEGQKKLGLPHPLSGVLWATGRHKANGKNRFSLSRYPGMALETELGFVVGEPIVRKVGSVAALKKHFRALAPVIELPGLPLHNVGPVTGADFIARNVTANLFIMGDEITLSKANADNIDIVLYKDGQQRTHGKSGAVHQGQWKQVLYHVNRALSQGYPVREGHVIITGALSEILYNEPGAYKADYGPLGTIEFVLIP